MIHISKSILRQTDKEYLAEMSQKKKTEQSETSFQKVLDAEIEKQKKKAAEIESSVGSIGCAADCIEVCQKRIKIFEGLLEQLGIK